MISVLGNLLEVTASECYIGGTVGAQMCYCKKALEFVRRNAFYGENVMAKPI